MDFDAFWKQFNIECQEHIDIIEGHLLSAEHSHVGPAGISELFRAFHSIKGLSKSMDLYGIESLAHVCEDILSLIREGKVVFTIEIIDHLLQALDNIKNMIELACNTRSNIDAPPNLLTELRHLYEELQQGQEDEDRRQAQEPAQVEPVAPAKVEESITAETNKDSNEFVPTFTEENPDDTIVVNHDNDTVGYFLEAISQELAELIACNPNEDQLAIQNKINTLRHSYVMMGFNQILFGLEDVLYSINDGEIKYFLNLARVFTDLHQIELNTGLLLLNKHDNPIEPLEKQICNIQSSFILNFFENYLYNKSQDCAVKDILNITLSIGYSILNIYPNLPVDIFLDLEVVISNFETLSTADPDNSHIKGISQFLREFINFLDSGSNDIAALIEKLHETHAHIIQICEKLPNNSVISQQIANQQSITKVFIETIGEDLLTGLQKRFKDGEVESLYVLLTYLEADQVIGEKFAMFATKQCELPFNRSVFIDNQNWYEFLIIYNGSEEKLISELRAIDSDNKYLQLNTEQTHAVRDLVKKGISQLIANNLIQEQLKMTEDQVDAQNNNLASTAHMQSGTQTPAISSSATSTDTIRIPGDVLDKFMNDIGEMVLACSHLNFTVTSHNFKSTFIDLETQIKNLFAKIKLPHAEVKKIMSSMQSLDKLHKNIAESNTLIHSILRYLQESALNLRVVPLETIFKRLPRIVRDVSKQLEKKITLVLEGQEVRIDKSMVETLVDPLIHMLRNSIDHGIEIPEVRIANGKNETGTIRISAVQQGNQIHLYIQDDGRGLDPDKILEKAKTKGLVDENATLSIDEIHQLIFHPGFSTATVVTEVSGRGVGMDVVKSNVTRVGGSISISSKMGQGTKIALHMPLSAAIQEVLIVRASNQIFALPSRFVTEIIEIPASNLMSLKGHPAILLRDHFLPISHLGFLLGFKKTEMSENEKIVIVVLSDGQSTLGLHVEEVINRSELYLKDVHQGIVNLPGVGGASILGDGRVVLVLDGERILSLATKSPSTPYHIINHHYTDIQEALSLHKNTEEIEENNDCIELNLNIFKFINNENTTLMDSSILEIKDIE